MLGHSMHVGDPVMEPSACMSRCPSSVVTSKPRRGQ